MVPRAFVSKDPRFKKKHVKVEDLLENDDRNHGWHIGNTTTAPRKGGRERKFRKRQGPVCSKGERVLWSRTYGVMGRQQDRYCMHALTKKVRTIKECTEMRRCEGHSAIPVHTLKIAYMLVYSTVYYDTKQNGAKHMIAPKAVLRKGGSLMGCRKHSWVSTW